MYYFLKGKKRVYDGVDLLRACALLLVFIYHCWVLTGSKTFPIPYLTDLVMLGGETGVTVFFVLSGYGIYHSLSSCEKDDRIDIVSFLKKRFWRIVPQYYLSIITVVFVGAGAVYLSFNGIWSIIVHLLFVHNLFMGTHGAINGALWTMGVIVQFYLVSPLLFSLLRKKGVFAEIGLIILTILVKFLLYSKILPFFNVDQMGYFIYGRQLFSAIDNFSTGMFVAYLIRDKKVIIDKTILKVGFPLLSILAFVLWNFFGERYGIHTNNISGYIWHSVLALIWGCMVFICSQIKIERIDPISGIMLWISKYEYGIYIWHLVVINNLLGNCQFIDSLNNSGFYYLIYPIFFLICAFVGYIYSVLTDSFVGHCCNKGELR